LERFPFYSLPWQDQHRPLYVSNVAVAAAAQSYYSQEDAAKSAMPFSNLSEDEQGWVTYVPDEICFGFFEFM
jgi:hypothetical protein